ncbi:hypothetical protein J1N35_041913 [Gossypium stocksii]|uniref:Reverse transcriptase domain-containing protein n=1 Tax=Gossypium stocksii TaxID=47602 RepID=A0A9D3UGG9_9ROSI|nr:hypothetical protein J1N35_041913 [Gossypium stocksii]
MERCKEFSSFILHVLRVHLAHLSFVDDLIFAKGTINLVIGIWCILQEFYYFSGLQLNVSKTEIFAAGMTEDDLVIVQRVTGFKLGRLSGKDFAATGARICWQSICLLKAEAGLGLRSLVDWNKAGILQKIKARLAEEFHGIS